MEHHDLPNVRPIPVVLSDMADIAAACGDPVDDADAAALFGRSLSLLLELRVPRMPDTEEELREMLASDGDAPSHSTEEAFRLLDAHRAIFTAFLERFRSLVAQGRWEDAAMQLMPQSEGIAWKDASCTLVVEGRRAVVTRGDGRRIQSSATGRMSALAAIMQAHIAWPDIWRR